MSDETGTSIHFQRATFLTSSPDLARCPADFGREVAFAGRSNAGKSTAINRLTRQNGLARTSKTPGRTQLINFFELSSDKRLVDLPGYGYAKVPQETRIAWQRNMDEYLRHRQSLKGLVVVSDIRQALQDFDRAMLTWAGEAGMPVHLLLTKSDKLKRGPAKNRYFEVLNEAATFGEHITGQLFSGLKGDGLDALEITLSGWLNQD